MPPTRREIYRRRRLSVFGFLAVVLAGLGYLGATGFAAVPTSTAAIEKPAALTQPAAEPAWPGFGESAIGAVGFPGVLASTGTDKPVPMASITKMITSLVVLDKKPLTGEAPGPELTFTAADVASYYDVIAQNGSVAPVVAGLKLSQRETMETMILPSANNYSISLAVWAFGSMDAYLHAADAWLTAHGLTDTTVTDTSGLSPGSVSTPSDLVEIGKLVAADPALASIVSMPTAKIPVIGTVTNTNKLLGHYGVDGIKTGTTDEAGACLLFSTDVTVGGRTVTVVGAVLGGTTHPELRTAVAALIKSVKAGFHEVELTKAGSRYAGYSTLWGEKTHAVATKAASALVWSDTPITATVTARPLQLGDKGDSAGRVDFAVGEKTVRVPLKLDATLSDPGPAWRFGHPGELANGH